MKQRQHRLISALMALVLCTLSLFSAAPANASSGEPLNRVIVLAQGGGTCTSPADEHGRIPLDGLEPAGDPYQECLQCITIPSVGQVGIFTTFDKYVDSEGRYYLIPNFFTAMYMAFTGWAPNFSVGPVDAALNGFELVAALMGRYENVGGIFEGLDLSLGEAAALTGRAVTNFTDWSDFTVEDVANIFQELAGDAMFWIRLNVMALRDDWARGSAISFRSMVLVYCEDPTHEPFVPISGANVTPVPTTNWTPPPTPTESVSTPPPPPSVTPVPTLVTPPPTPTPGNPSTPTPTATPGRCATASVSRSGPGTILFEKLAPPNPVVVGQDESKRGVDVRVRIVSPAVIYTYEKYEVVSFKTECCHSMGGCKDEDYDGCKYGWEGWSKKTTEEWGCKQYKETYADPVDLGTLQVKAVLTAESRAWIANELARKYPGAKVRHPDWEIIPKDGWAAHDGIGSDKVYILDAIVRYIPFEDPGRYEMLVSGRTTGTPYTQAVPFNYNGGTFNVFLIETALIK
ncbi:MAG: hypothetical protein JXM73_15415 [Anaerolineae bacterium]|nr:hypothetical protein [Anaerolineae bacterium]